MKIKKQEIIRIENIINGDRQAPDDNFKSLLLTDLNNLLSDYFNLTLNPELKVVKSNSGFNVEIFFMADSIKKFQYLKD